MKEVHPHPDGSWHITDTTDTATSVEFYLDPEGMSISTSRVLPLIGRYTRQVVLDMEEVAALKRYLDGEAI